jgi:hypothetical protein
MLLAYAEEQDESPYAYGPRSPKPRLGHEKKKKESQWERTPSRCHAAPCLFLFVSHCAPPVHSAVPALKRHLQSLERSTVIAAHTPRTALAVMMRLVVALRVDELVNELGDRRQAGVE